MDKAHLRFLPGRWESIGVSRRTWTRWLKGTSRIPTAVILLARILSGSLDELHPTWQGWTINRRTGELVDPEGIAHTPATIRTWHWTAQQLSALRAEENQQEKIKRLRTPSDGAALTQAMHQRLENKS